MYTCRLSSSSATRLLLRPLHFFRMASTYRERSVVSSFICKPTSSPAGFKVAIFKRSQDVSTYKGKWAACSGSIDPTDPSPEEAAKREIREETTLTDADISLFRRGKPFSLTDEGLKTKWTIHPFAWMMKPDAKDIVFDWEHTEYAFIEPGKIMEYDTVPNLDFGLGRCLVGAETEKALNALRDDHESGAHAMATSALDMLLRIVQSGDLSDAHDAKAFWEDLRMVAWHLAKNGRPSMGAAIEVALLKVLGIMGPQSWLNESSRRDNAASAIQTYIQDRNKCLVPLTQYFVEYAKSTLHAAGTGTASEVRFLTLSASGTVKQALVGLISNLVSKRRKVKLDILESRPNLEGVTFVNALLEGLEVSTDIGEDHETKLKNIRMNLRIDIVSDASVAMVVKDADFLLLGADRVLPAGDVSNKIGSLAAAVLAKTLNPACRVVVLFETDKIACNSEHASHLNVEYNDTDEVTKVWPSDVRNSILETRRKGYEIGVKNAYFEWVPAKYIHCYLTECGILAAEDIGNMFAETEKLQEELFGDL